MFEDALPEKIKAVLKKITPVVKAQGFYLAGGTGLALQIGHRISEILISSGIPPLIPLLYFQFSEAKRNWLKRQ